MNSDAELGLRMMPVFLLFLSLWMIKVAGVIPRHISESVEFGWFITVMAFFILPGALFMIFTENWKAALVTIWVVAFLLYSLLGAVIIGILELQIFGSIMHPLAFILALINLLLLGFGGGRGTGGTGGGGEKKTEHYDRYGKYIGYSVREGDRIVYYNAKGKYIGESYIREDEEKYGVGRPKKIFQ